MRKTLLTATALALVLALSSAIRAHAAAETTYQMSSTQLLRLYDQGPAQQQLAANQLVLTAFKALVSYNLAEGLNVLAHPSTISDRAILFCPPTEFPEPDQLLNLLKAGIEPSSGTEATPDEPFEGALIKTLIKTFPCPEHKAAEEPNPYAKFFNTPETPKYIPEKELQAPTQPTPSKPNPTGPNFFDQFDAAPLEPKPSLGRRVIHFFFPEQFLKDIGFE